MRRVENQHQHRPSGPEAPRPPAARGSRASANANPGSPARGWLAGALLLATIVLGGPVAPASAQIDIPGPELFAKPPETPMELWDAVDYLVNVGKADQAVPYLKAFLAADPGDDVLLQVKDRYGAGAILRLEDFPATRPYAEPLVEQLNAAARRRASDPDRLRRFARALAASEAEQEYAVDQLRVAGPYGVPAVLEALGSPALSVEQRTRIARNLGRLDATATPALVAALDAPDDRLAADVADALGRIGDPRAIPFLTYPAANDARLVVRDPARQAIERITGTSYAAQAKAPVRLLVDEAKAYLTHDVTFAGPGDRTEVWTWEDGRGPTPRDVSRSEAEGYLGLKLARQALDLAPEDREAQAVATGLALQKAVGRSGLANLAADPTGALATALAAGPDVLGDVLRLALAEELTDLSAAATIALGRVAGRDALVETQGGYHPLVEALNSPDRRTRLAAARALVTLDPRGTFPGASRVVPVLAQFVTMRDVPQAVVIDGDVNRGGQVAAVLRELGYDASAVNTGKEGFQIAAGSAGVELVMIHPGLLDGAWKTLDTLTNLRSDPATAGIPILLYGPLGMRHSPVDVVPPVLILDPDTVRGNQLAQVLRSVGFSPNLVGTGADALRVAAERPPTALFIDVLGDQANGPREPAAILELANELRRQPPTAETPIVLVGPHQGQGPYAMTLRLERSAYVSGPFSPVTTPVEVINRLVRDIEALGVQPFRPERVPAEARSRVLAQIDPEHYPRTGFTVEPSDAQAFGPILQRELSRMGAQPFSAEERPVYAQAAAALLATVATRPGSPYEPDIPAVEPALAEALVNPATAPASTVALGDVPSVDAQRRLAESALDTSLAPERRLAAADALTRSIQRFGPLLVDSQERALLQARDGAGDPTLRAVLSGVIGALRPQPDVIAPRLRALDPSGLLPAPSADADADAGADAGAAPTE